MNPKYAGTLPEPRLQSVKKKPAPKPAVTTRPMQTRAASSKPGQAATAIAATAKTAAPVAGKKAATKQEAARSMKPGDLILVTWPIVIAVFLAGFAPEWHEMAQAAGRWPLRFTFPYSLLLLHREIGISDSLAQILPRLAIYLQIPIDGILLTLALARKRSLLSGIVQILLVHGLCTFVLFLLDYL